MKLEINFYDFFVPNGMKWEALDNFRSKTKELEKLKTKTVSCKICGKKMILNEESVQAGHGESAQKFYYKCMNCRIKSVETYGRSTEEQIKALQELQNEN